MLIEYEFQVLSLISDKTILKTNNDLCISLNKIQDIDENILMYIDKLSLRNIVNLKGNNLTIYVRKWTEFFVAALRVEFHKNKLNVECIFNSQNQTIEFVVNNSHKIFKLAFSAELGEDEEDTIFMYMPNIYDCKIFWLDLINDRNMLNIFYCYIINEVNSIQANDCQEINIFEGISELYLSEIFNISIKNYFMEKGNELVDIRLEEKNLIKKIIRKNDINCYAVEINGYKLCLVKDERKIKFFTLKNSQIVHVKNIDEQIDSANQLLMIKVSEFRKLVMFKENNIVDNTVKLATNGTKLFVPLTLILNIISMLNLLDIKKIINYKWMLWLSVIILLTCQLIIIYFVYLPSFRISKFKWDI